MNQPGIQNWLQEMKDESLSQYDIDCWRSEWCNPDNAEEWVGDKGKFNMIFQFEHLGLWVQVILNLTLNHIKRC